MRPLVCFMRYEIKLTQLQLLWQQFKMHEQIFLLY